MLPLHKRYRRPTITYGRIHRQYNTNSDTFIQNKLISFSTLRRQLNRVLMYPFKKKCPFNVVANVAFWYFELKLNLHGPKIVIKTS